MTTVPTAKTGTAEARYNELLQSRNPFLQRARDAASLTLPYLFPPEGFSSSAVLPTPRQGIGARGVNNLASKLLLALFPPNQPCFKYELDDFMVATLAGNETARAKIDGALMKIVRAVQSDFEGSAIRVTAHDAIKQLIVGGNALWFTPASGSCRMYKLEQYVCRRSPDGKVIEGVISETVHIDTLDKDVLAIVRSDSKKSPKDKTVKVFTWIRRTSANKFEYFQEICGTQIPGSEGSYLEEAPHFQFLRWTKVDGEDYGRGYVEEYLGELNTHEGLTQALVEGAAAAAKVLFFVNPNGVTQEVQVAKANNCDVLSGKSEDVSVLQLQKFADFRVASETLNTIQERLTGVFLLNSAVQRNAERVTAEEIRFVAGELEDALGGIYSIFSIEFQLPLVLRVVNRLQQAKRVPTLPKKSVKPVVVTGLEALGRNHEVTRLRMFIQDATSLLGQEAVLRNVNARDALERLATGYGLSVDDGLIKDEKTIADEDAAAQQQAMQQEMLSKGTGPAINAMAQAQQQQQ